jgi:hypothetical protein
LERETRLLAILPLGSNVANNSPKKETMKNKTVANWVIVVLIAGLGLSCFSTILANWTTKQLYDASMQFEAVITQYQQTIKQYEFSLNQSMETNRQLLLKIKNETP